MALYHIRARTTTRASGASAAAAAAYLLRLGKYAKAGRDPCVFSLSANMPTWAAASHQRLEYWRAADLYERANGRLAKTLEFALPLELNHAQRVALAREFCTQVARTDKGKPLPLLMAVHAGHGSNPHCHLMVSERVLDGHDRTPDTWFSRAAPKGQKPGTGGAKKTGDLKPLAWLQATRELLARVTNEALAAAGFTARVDHRSLTAQGIERVPGVHLGAAGSARLRRGAHSRRAEDLDGEREAQQLIHELRREARSIDLELATLKLSTDPTQAPTTTAAMLARAQKQKDAAVKKTERKKENDFEFRP